MSEVLVPTVITSTEALEVINRSEIDIQITTAKTYPRDLHAVLDKIATIATYDEQTAAECFYALKRGKGDDMKIIEGLSVRMAEIIANSWGNLRIQSNIIGNDGKTIVVRGMCHDLETNVAVSVEVRRRITDKYGKTYSEDMQVVTGNAAAAIAFRNAVLKVVPKAFTKKIIEDVRNVAMGQALDLETSRQNCIANYAKLFVTTEMLLDYCECKSIEEITKEKIFILKGIYNAIKEGTTTAAEEIINPFNEKKEREAKVKEAKESTTVAEAKVKEAMKESKGNE